MTATLVPGLAHERPHLPEPIIVARGGGGGLLHRNENAHLQYWTGQDIHVEIHSQRLHDTYQDWIEKAAKGTPRLTDIMTSNMKDANHDAMLLELFIHSNQMMDYLVVSQGGDYLRNSGLDMRGKLQSEIKTPISEAIKELYDQCLGGNMPIYSRFDSLFAQKRTFWESLCLPLAAAKGQTPTFIMNYVIPVEARSDLLQALVDSDDDAIIAGIPDPEDQSKFPNGKIITINTRAKELLHLNREGQSISRIHQFPYRLQSLYGLTPKGSTAKGRTTVFHYADKASAEFQIEMSVHRRFRLFRILYQPLEDG